MKLLIITGACGAGKSTIKDQLAAMLDPELYACVDSDETGLNWWDYAGTDRESQYGADTLKEAFRMAGGRNLVFVTCMVPQDYMTKTTVPEELDATYHIALWAPDEVIGKRLRARPKERGSLRTKQSGRILNITNGSEGTGESISYLSTTKHKARKKPQRSLRNISKPCRMLKRLDNPEIIPPFGKVRRNDIITG